MNFELFEVADSYIRNGELAQAISFAEEELRKQAVTPFHDILDKDLLHLTQNLSDYFSAFYENIDQAGSIQAFYCEMNGFTINYGLWFLELFAYDRNEGLDDLDWLSDWQWDTEASGIFTLTGYEKVQEAFQLYDGSTGTDKARLKDAADTCELLVILRLQELIKNTVAFAKEAGLKWSHIPVLATAHDYDLIYQAD